jgi:hypothetical protein
MSSVPLFMLIEYTLSFVELSNKPLGRHRAIRLFEQRGDLSPVELRGIQKHPQPIPESARGTRLRFEESHWLGRDHSLLNTGSYGEPKRHPPISAMVIVVVAEGALVLNKKTGSVVTQPLVHLRQREGYLAHIIEFSSSHGG